MLGLLLERSKARMLGGYSDMAAWKLEREGAGRPEFPSLLAFQFSSFPAFLLSSLLAFPYGCLGAGTLESEEARKPEPSRFLASQRPSFPWFAFSPPSVQAS